MSIEDVVKSLISAGPVALVLFWMLRWALNQVTAKDVQLAAAWEKFAGLCEEVRDELRRARGA